jgi:hypothetical protein
LIFFSNYFDILLILNFIGETFEIYFFHGEHKNKKILPKSIFKLQNLQVLVVGEEGSEELPTDENQP